MVSTDDLQRPSMDMSKIIVAMGIGLFSLLILNIFDLLSFWTLVAVLVGVAMVLKFGAPSVGTVLVIVVTSVIILWLGSVDWQKMTDGGSDVYRPKLEKGLEGWTSEGEIVVRDGCYEISPGSSMLKTVALDGVNVKLYGVEADPSSFLNIEIKDLDGYGRSAVFKFSIEGNDISFLESRNVCGEILKFKVDPITNELLEMNCAQGSVKKRTISYAIGNNEDGRISYFYSNLPKSLERRQEVNYKITLKNSGGSSIKIGRIEIVSG